MRTRRMRCTGGGGQERQDADPSSDALQCQGGGGGDADAGGDHGLGLLVVVGLIGDLRLETGRAAAAGEGLGHRVVVGTGDPGVVLSEAINRPGAEQDPAAQDPDALVTLVIDTLLHGSGPRG